MQEQGLDETILKKMGLPTGEKPNLEPWKEFLKRRSQATDEVKIALSVSMLNCKTLTNPYWNHSRRQLPTMIIS
jgi:CTP synthase (UTP-ammonia lyase)